MWPSQLLLMAINSAICCFCAGTVLYSISRDGYCSLLREEGGQMGHCCWASAWQVFTYNFLYLFLRWRRGKSNNSGYRFEFLNVTLRHATLFYRLFVPTAWTANSIEHTDTFCVTTAVYLNYCSCFFFCLVISSSLWLCIVHVTMIISGWHFCFQWQQFFQWK